MSPFVLLMQTIQNLDFFFWRGWGGGGGGYVIAAFSNYF